ncbi:MAG: GNAT family N-acetyltransferase [Pelagibacterium sp. SCN 63-23]|nr:MAG: GNAT family N-acetyltransferase [Pelagibacterium sp. SCN 63-23]
MPETSSLAIRAARQGDARLILDFVRDLAEYEQLLHEVEASEADIERDFFGPQAKVFGEIAEWEGKPVGFALWFYTYSTFQGRHGIWLEDLYVDPALRGKGIGKALLVHLAQRCARENLGRFEWWVLDWNEPSIKFYQSQGGVLQDEWTKVRISGPALERLAAQ